MHSTFKHIKSCIFIICFITANLINQTIASAAESSKKVTWQLAQTWGDEHLLGYPTTRLAQLVDALSGGSFKIELVSKKTHGNTRGVFDFVKEGKYQMGHSASNFWAKKDPDTVFFSAVPFGMVTPELYSWFYEGGGLELMNKVYGKHGLMSFPGGNSGHQMIGWFNKEIRSLEDLKGLKMRLPGLAGEVMKGVGVNIINPPVSKLKEALKSGELEAVEFVGPAIDLNLGLADVAKFYYVGWHSPSSEMQFIVNPEAFKKLSNKNKEILKQSMRLAAYDAFTKIVNENGIKMQELLTQYPHIVLRSFPNDVMRALAKQTAVSIDKLIEKSDDKLTQEIVTSMREHRKRARVWTRFSDQAYLNNVGAIIQD